MKSHSTVHRLLKLLKDADSSGVSGEEVSHRLGVTRSAVWKHVDELREAGYAIEASPQRGYRLLSAPDRLIPTELEGGLETTVIGRRILCYETLDSTNRLAMELASKGAPEGVVIFAEEQTLGRGRLGRSWASPKGVGLYFSVILRPPFEPQKAPRVTLAAAVAVRRALAQKTGLRILVRWPNDLLVGGEKLCGILTEMGAESDRLGHVVVGIGVNVNSPKKALPPGGVSLKTATGRGWNRCELARAILEELERFYGMLLRGEFAPIAEMWEEASALTGRRIAARTLSGNLEGVAAGIDGDGALWIRQDSGLNARILSGDIVFLR